MPKPSITTFSSIAVDPSATSRNNGLYAPQLTTVQRDAIPAGLLRNGAIIYNITDNQLQSYVDGNWVDTGEGGDVRGPAMAVDNNIATFDGVTGKLIQDSGVIIGRVALANLENTLVDDVNEISNLGHLKFINDIGIIYVDSFSPVKFIANDFGPETQVCSLFTGQIPDASTTPSALVELQSTTGALLLSRMTTVERDALITPIDAHGMMLFNTDTEKLSVYNGTDWETIVSSEFATFYPPTYNNQLAAITQGYNQGGLGGGSMGTNKAMSANTTIVFDTTTVNSNSKGFFGGVFDGRYIYLVPNNNGAVSGQITRYDTTLPFASSASYSFFDTTTVNSNSKGFQGGVFDGKYIYLIPNNNGAVSGQITRYDTTLSFASPTSYSFFDMTTVNSNCTGFAGGVFDGKYIYFVPDQSPAGVSGQITRYDTTLPFNLTASYSFLDTGLITPTSRGFFGGVFDGRYIYLIPYLNLSGYSGQITRYDTTLSFTSSASYSFFDMATVNNNCRGFIGGVFDGRYIYFVPYHHLSGYSGQITRYDTTLPFNLTTSYSFFDTTTVNSNSKGFFGGVFDGKYIYLVPYNNSSSGQITRYDTTLPFASPTSYSFFDTSIVNSHSKGFFGGVFDGKYIYLVPYVNFAGYSGQITRIDAYTGPQVNLPSNITDNLAKGSLTNPLGGSISLIAGIWTRIAINSTPVLLYNFDIPLNSTLRYIGPLTSAPTLQINFNITFNTGTATAITVTIGIYKNGVILNGSITGLAFATTNFQSLSTNILTTANNGDIFQPYIEVSRNDTTFISYMTLSAITI